MWLVYVGFWGENCYMEKLILLYMVRLIHFKLYYYQYEFSFYGFYGSFNLYAYHGNWNRYNSTIVTTILPSHWGNPLYPYKKWNLKILNPPKDSLTSHKQYPHIQGIQLLRRSDRINLLRILQLRSTLTSLPVRLLCKVEATHPSMAAGETAIRGQWPGLKFAFK